jgi:hypothetical protein
MNLNYKNISLQIPDIKQLRRKEDSLQENSYELVCFAKGSDGLVYCVRWDEKSDGSFDIENPNSVKEQKIKIFKFEVEIKVFEDKITENFDLLDAVIEYILSQSILLDIPDYEKQIFVNRNSLKKQE